MPTRQLARLAVLLAVAALAVPSPAAAQQAPSLGAPAQTDTAPVVTTTGKPGDGGLKSWQELLIFAGGVVLLGGIAWAIVSDARNRAPVVDRRRSRDDEDGAGGPGSRLSPHERRRRKERARAKARAARAARKRTKRAR
jgi:hypothetical protein